MDKQKLLFIDDDRNFIKDIMLILSGQFECSSAYTIESGLPMIPLYQPDVVFLDLMLENGVSGLTGIQRILQIDDTLPIIMITDYASIPTAVEAIRLGASDYISKTSNLQELKLIIERSLDQKYIRTRINALEEELAKPFRSIVGESEAMKKMKNEISLVAMHDATCLIVGESGVGKELVARQVHKLSKRRDAPFVAVNCAAIPRELIESEFFGHERGAFTGAHQRRVGKFELTKDGTIFLDEISEMEEQAQVRLLRVLQEKEFERVGGTSVLKTPARVIAATNKNLEQLVNDGKFRYDLFYRLNVFPIVVPPLRERKSDIPLLVEHFLRQISAETKTGVKEMSNFALAKFSQYDWPGNVRELQNIVMRSVILAHNQSVVNEKVIDAVLREGKAAPNVVPTTWEEMIEERKRASSDASRAVETAYINYVLKIFNGNVSEAAKYSKINRTNFHKMMKKAGIR